MKYIITEAQYRLLIEQDDILNIHFGIFNDDWNLLQKFLERRGNPPYKISGDLDLYETPIESLGSLISVGGNLDLYDSNVKSLGNLRSVGGYLDLRNTPISETHSKEDIRDKVNVDGEIYL
jgi:hypothetical protein